MKKIMTIVGLFLLTQMAVADSVLVLEAPQEYSVQQGVTTIRGYALADAPIVQVRMSIDEGEWQTIPHGGKRDDVAAQYFGKFADVEGSGFSATISWRKYDPEVDHEIVIQMLALDGEVAETYAMFNTARLNPVDEWEKRAVLEFSAYKPTEGGYILTNLIIGETLYDSIEFQWNNRTQNFSIINVVRTKF